MCKGNRIVRRGPWGTVEWAMDRRGRTPAREFFEGLSDADKAKVLTLCRYLAAAGHIKHPEKFKKLGRFGEENLYELKSFQIRLLGSYRTSRFMVAIGVRKKRDDHRRQDIEAAIRVLKENDTMEGSQNKADKRGGK